MEILWQLWSLLIKVLHKYITQTKSNIMLMGWSRPWHPLKFIIHSHFPIWSLLIYIVEEVLLNHLKKLYYSVAPSETGPSHYEDLQKKLSGIQYDDALLLPNRLCLLDCCEWVQSSTTPPHRSFLDFWDPSISVLQPASKIETQLVGAGVTHC